MRKIFDKIKIKTTNPHNIYVLTLSEWNKVVAISVDDFNRWNDAVVVRDFKNLTEEDMNAITGGSEYEFIENVLDKKYEKI